MAGKATKAPSLADVTISQIQWCPRPSGTTSLVTGKEVLAGENGCTENPQAWCFLTMWIISTRQEAIGIATDWQAV